MGECSDQEPAVKMSVMTGILWNIALGTGLAAYGLVDRLRTGRRREDWRTRNGDVPVPPRGTAPRILLHGVSVGEINAAKPLVDALTTGVSPMDVVVSVSTTTGFRRAREQYGDRNPVVRFPFDLTWMVDRFLDRVDPDVVVLLEQELWPGFLQRCEARSIAVILANARMSQASFRRYRRLGPLSRRLLGRLALVICQSDAYRQQFERLGVPPSKTAVVGSLKWDATRLPDDDRRSEELARTLALDRSLPLVVAGSTGPGEEARLISGLPEGVQLLLAPRRPERWDEVAGLAPAMPRRSRGSPENRPPTHSPRVFLLDSIGELTDAYRLADVVFVGRSLVPQGGSNPLEPASLGKPAVIGPHHENFRDVVETLVTEGGLVVSDDPMSVFRAWLEDGEERGRVAAAALATVEANRGTAARTAALIRELVPAPPVGPHG